ncbi:MAG: hypothetical protein ACYC4H_00670 [Desulfocucumaceae bacterium]
MPIEKREKPVIKGENAKKFFKKEKNVEDKIKKYVEEKKIKFYQKNIK